MWRNKKLLVFTAVVGFLAILVDSVNAGKSFKTFNRGILLTCLSILNILMITAELLFCFHMSVIAYFIIVLRKNRSLIATRRMVHTNKKVVYCISVQTFILFSSYWISMSNISGSADEIRWLFLGYTKSYILHMALYFLIVELLLNKFKDSRIPAKYNRYIRRKLSIRLAVDKARKDNFRKNYPVLHKLYIAMDSIVWMVLYPLQVTVRFTLRKMFEGPTRKRQEKTIRELEDVIEGMKAKLEESDRKVMQLELDVTQQESEDEHLEDEEEDEKEENDDDKLEDSFEVVEYNHQPAEHY